MVKIEQLNTIGNITINFFGNNVEVPYCYHKDITEEYIYLTTDTKLSNCEIFFSPKSKELIATYPYDLDTSFHVKVSIMVFADKVIGLMDKIKDKANRSLTNYERSRKRKMNDYAMIKQLRKLEND